MKCKYLLYNKILLLTYLKNNYFIFVLFIYKIILELRTIV